MVPEFVRPRFGAALGPGGRLAIVDMDSTYGEQEWRGEFLTLIRAFSPLNHYELETEVVRALETSGHFVREGEAAAPPVAVEQSVDDYMAMLASTSSFSRTTLGPRADDFEREARAIFARRDDPDIAIVIEVIGGTDPAEELDLGAFERKKHLVTANKELVAKEWKALHEAARLAKRELRFEAAVAAAVPVIAGMRGLGAVRPRVLRGLLNGTTTYICSRMETGKSFAEALAEAMAAGYAEADPTNDVDGHDA